MKKGRIDIISMGCSKNLVDSERLIKRLQTKGYTAVHDSDKPSGEWVMVNTCGFIGDAKEESINLILSLIESKKSHKIGKIAVMGCLSQRYLDELKAELPEVDLWYGKFDWKSFINQLPDIKNEATNSVKSLKSWERTLTTPPYSAYLKISEGCNRFCAYCAIPIITGRHKSRPIDEILEEVTKLASEGVKEFNVIAQDLSFYGYDIDGKSHLAELIDKMADIKGVEWIRLHYAYPTDFPMDILDVMARRDNVCNYLDIALQHIADPVLTNMRRHISKEETINLLKEIRKRVPEIRIRTTLMVGFPGEGEEEFKELLDFAKEARFDRMGAFAYCEEDDTYAAKNFKDEIPEEVKQERLDQLMEVQEKIALELNEELVGRKVKVLIERHEDGNSVGRTEWDSPEVDPEVIVENTLLPIGEFAEVEITDAFPFELIATSVKNS